jgi:hypothetical protein
MCTHLEIFAQIKNLEPSIIPNPIRPKFEELPLMYADPTKLGVLEVQYRNLLSANWLEIFPDDNFKFWAKAITLKNGCGDPLFRELSLFVFKMLSLPSPNGVVERSFSMMNIIKCKLRNKMILNMLNSIMLPRYHFYVNNILLS